MSWKDWYLVCGCVLLLYGWFRVGRMPDGCAGLVVVILWPLILFAIVRNRIVGPSGPERLLDVVAETVTGEDRGMEVRDEVSKRVIENATELLPDEANTMLARLLEACPHHFVDESFRNFSRYCISVGSGVVARRRSRVVVRIEITFSTRAIEWFVCHDWPPNDTEWSSNGATMPAWLATAWRYYASGIVTEYAAEALVDALADLEEPVPDGIRAIVLRAVHIREARLRGRKKRQAEEPEDTAEEETGGPEDSNQPD